jgi:hypothetical protein
MDNLGFYVMRNEGGVTMWLSDDERTWTPHFHNGASFTNAKLADDIAKRQLADDQTFYVLACMGSEPDEEC